MKEEMLEEAWKHRPIHLLTGMTYKEYKETLKSPEKLKSLEKYLNIVRQVTQKVL